MKCSKCGSEILSGRLYCPTCGKEVQLVPDFNPFENIMTQQSRQKEQQKIEAEMERKRLALLTKRKKNRFLASFVLIGSFALLLMLSKLYLDNKNYNSYSYQINKAEIAYSNRDYEKAFTYADRAITLNSQNVDANLLMAHILDARGDSAGAIKTIQAVIEEHEDNKVAYGQLLRLYEKLDMTSEIKELMDDCDNEIILDAFSNYVTKEPITGLQPGTYKYAAKVDLFAAEETSIYYTLDGTTPTEQSTLYTKPIQLEEGITHINAISINEKHIVSDVVTFDYTISIPGPDIPKVSPSSGNFETSTKIMVSVPVGCTAYYEFDDTPTKDSERYEGPIDMPEGEHIFRVILIDKNGKSSHVASQTYILEFSEITK